MASAAPNFARDLGFRFELQRAALAELDPSWLPQLAPELVRMAREVPEGRRWLARHLPETSLFGEPTPIGQGDGWRWLLQPLGEHRSLMLDLGALLLSARLRTVVERAPLARLRAVLGEARYRLVLTARDLDSVPGSRGEPDCSQLSEDALRALLLGHGRLALHAQLQTVQAALADRVALSGPRDAVRAAQVTPSAGFAAALDEHARRHQGQPA